MIASNVVRKLFIGFAKKYLLHTIYAKPNCSIIPSSHHLVEIFLASESKGAISNFGLSGNGV
jgi:hypothetical protein